MYFNYESLFDILEKYSHASKMFMNLFKCTDSLENVNYYYKMWNVDLENITVYSKKCSTHEF